MKIPENVWSKLCFLRKLSRTISESIKENLSTTSVCLDFLSTLLVSSRRCVNCSKYDFLSPHFILSNVVSQFSESPGGCSMHRVPAAVNCSSSHIWLLRRRLLQPRSAVLTAAKSPLLLLCPIHSAGFDGSESPAIPNSPCYFSLILFKAMLGMFTS